MIGSIFNSQNVITEHISNADLKTYFVGFEYGQYKYDPLVQKIMSSIVDFAFGFHEEIPSKYTINDIKKAACMVYKIEEFDSNNPDHQVRYPKNHATKAGLLRYNNADEFYEAKYADRGEFGELILHLLLRDFLHTLPLVSKIFAKNSPWVPAHWFDAVHIGNSISDPTKRSLYLGESKLHKKGDSGVSELIKDIEKHFIKDFLTTPAGEFVMIWNKKRSYVPKEEYKDLNTKEEYEKFLEEKKYWFDRIDGLQEGESLQQLFESITIPLLCTYPSDIFSSARHTIVQDSNSVTEEFNREYMIEMQKLKKQLDDGILYLKKKYEKSWEPVSTNLNIVLMLFPIPCKKELVKKLHTKLYHQQNS